MLTRNCVKKLFKPNDTNARLTVFSKTPKYYTPIAYKSMWIDTIRTSLGQGIINAKDARFIEVTAANGYCTNGFMTGSQLISKLQDSFREPVSLRISFPDWPTKSWIIVLENDLDTLEN